MAYLHGHIKNQDGNPIVGAIVSLVGGDLDRYTEITDANGYYRIDVITLSGEFRVRASATGYKTKIKRLQRARGGKYQILDFKLNPVRATIPTTPAPTGPTSPGRVWGYVKDSKKKNPISGVAVSIPSLGLSATTNASGYYEILSVNARGSLQIIAEITGYNRGKQNISRANNDESTGPIDFELNQIGSVPVPTRILASTGIPFNKIIGSLTSIILGLIASAALGNPWFFFGFVLIGASIVMPNVEDMNNVIRLMRNVRIHNNARIQAIQSDNTISESEKSRQIKDIVDAEKNTLQIENMIRRRAGQTDRNVINMRLILKHLLKALGAGAFVLAFVNTGIPFSNILALVAAFVGYFAMGGSRIPSTNTEAES